MAQERVSEVIVSILKKTKGVSNIDLDRRKKHLIVMWEFEGKNLRYTCPCSASDYRSRLNCLSDVKRMMRDARRGGDSSRSTS